MTSEAPVGPDARVGAGVGADAYRAAIDAFGEVANALGDISEIDELLHVIAAKVCSLVGVSRCSIHLRDDAAAGTYRGAIGHAGSDIDAYVKRSRAGMPADGITNEILRTKAPVIISDARTDPRPVKSTVRFWGIRSMMAVPMVLGGEVIGIIFLDDEHSTHAFSSTDQAIASAFGELAAVAVQHTQTLGDMTTRMQAIARQNHGLKRATVLDERLTELVVDGADLQTITLTLAELMGKPCALHSVDGVRLSAAAPPGADDGILPRLLERPFCDVSYVREAIVACEERRGALVGPFVEAGLPHRFLLAPVGDGGNRVGTLVVMEHHSRFNSTDLMVVRRAATLVGLHVKMERAAVEADANAGASLAGELLRGNPDTAMLRRRAEHLGIDLEAPRRVCVLRTREAGAATLNPHAALAAFLAVDPARPPIVTAQGNDVAVLLPVAADDGSEASATAFEQLVQHVCEALGEGSVLAGISTPCTGPRGYVRGYADAAQALACLARFWTPRSRPVVAADSLGPGRLFLAQVETDAAVEFALGALEPLLSDQSGVNVLATLHVFFADTTSVRRCADRLGVHENTIRYRLARVGQLTGLAVTSDPDAQLSARLALLILALRGTVDLRELEQQATGTQDADLRVVCGTSGDAVGDRTMA